MSSSDIAASFLSRSSCSGLSVVFFISPALLTSRFSGPDDPHDFIVVRVRMQMHDDYGRARWHDTHGPPSYLATFKAVEIDRVKRILPDQLSFCERDTVLREV